MRLKRFKGLICPDMAGSYEKSLDVRNRKSIWMVNYLRARRTGDKLKAFYRMRHLAEKRFTERHAAKTWDARTAPKHEAD